MEVEHDGTKFEANVDLDFQGQPLALKMTGTLVNGEMKGAFEGPGVPPSTFSAKKAKKEESEEKEDN